jgi:hypothetical protein
MGARNDFATGVLVFVFGFLGVGYLAWIWWGWIGFAGFVGLVLVIAAGVVAVLGREYDARRRAADRRTGPTRAPVVEENGQERRDGQSNRRR